jgi:hypothetical protein
MKQPNQNQISPFLVISNLAKLDGAEKALVKIIAALFPELHSFFSPIVWCLEPQQTLPQS